MVERRDLQLSFGEADGKMFVPENILDKPWGKEVKNFLKDRKIWNDRPNGAVAGFEISSDKFLNFTFNPSNWQEIQTENKRYAGVLILLEDFSSFDKSFFDNFPLKKRSPFYIFEKTPASGLSVEEKEKRVGILKELGLVEAHVFTRKVSGFVVWEARVEKERVTREINLLDEKKHPRSCNWARRLWKEMAAEYQACGFRVISGPDSPIVKRLKASKNPPDDLGRLKMGWGVEIKNPSCGCHIKVSLDGDFNWIYFCGDETHHSVGKVRTLSTRGKRREVKGKRE
jgi:hypothetical protein